MRIYPTQLFLLHILLFPSIRAMSFVPPVPPFSTPSGVAVPNPRGASLSASPGLAARGAPGLRMRAGVGELSREMRDKFESGCTRGARCALPRIFA